MARKTDNYELHSRMEEIEAAFPPPKPEAWAEAARVIQEHCPDWDNILTMVIDPEQASA